MVGTNYSLGNYKLSSGKGPNKVSINKKIYVFSNNQLIYISNMKRLKAKLRST